MELRFKEPSLKTEIMYKLDEAPYTCHCGHRGPMREIMENNWNCPCCGWARWELDKNTIIVK